METSYADISYNNYQGNNTTQVNSSSLGTGIGRNAMIVDDDDHDHDHKEDADDSSDVFSPMSLLDIMTMDTPSSHVDSIMQELQRIRLEADHHDNSCYGGSAFSSPQLKPIRLSIHVANDDDDGGASSDIGRHQYTPSIDDVVIDDNRHKHPAVVDDAIDPRLQHNQPLHDDTATMHFINNKDDDNGGACANDEQSQGHLLAAISTASSTSTIVHSPHVSHQQSQSITQMYSKAPICPLVLGSSSIHIDSKDCNHINPPQPTPTATTIAIEHPSTTPISSLKHPSTTSIATIEHPFTTPIATIEHNEIKTVSKYSSTVKDIRTRGDFCVWSSGARLTVAEIKREYVGLRMMLLTLNNVEGMLVPAVVPSDVKYQDIILSSGVKMSSHSLGSLDGSKLGRVGDGDGSDRIDRGQRALSTDTAHAHAVKHSVGSIDEDDDHEDEDDDYDDSYREYVHGLSSQYGPQYNTDALNEVPEHTADQQQYARSLILRRIHLMKTAKAAGMEVRGQYHAVHLMECVIRPDIDLSDVIASIHAVARIMNYRYITPHNNHVLIEGVKAPSAATALRLQSSPLDTTKDTPLASTRSSTAAVAAELVEFDLIDVQVVLASHLRQRVVICVFLRRAPRIDSSGIGGMIIHQLSGGNLNLPLTQCPKTRLFISKLKVKTMMMMMMIVQMMIVMAIM